MSSIAITKTTVNSGIPVWQKIVQWAQGGFTLSSTGLVAGSTVKAGTPLSYNEATRVAALVATFEIFENATNVATQYKIKKGSQAAIGKHVSLTVGGTAYTITALDTSNATYDLITLGTTLGTAVTADVDVLYESSAAGATAGAYAQTAEGLLYEDTEILTGVTQYTVSIVTDGTVYARRVPRATAAIKLTLPHIIYSESF